MHFILDRALETFRDAICARLFRKPELVSPSDSLKKTQEKMQEYMENGCRLGWLINRKKLEVEIYRPGQNVEVLQSPLTLSGENFLPGFVLNLQKIWN